MGPGQAEEEAEAEVEAQVDMAFLAWRKMHDEEGRGGRAGTKEKKRKGEKTREEKRQRNDTERHKIMMGNDLIYEKTPPTSPYPHVHTPSFRHTTDTHRDGVQAVPLGRQGSRQARCTNNVPFPTLNLFCFFSFSHSSFLLLPLPLPRSLISIPHLYLRYEEPHRTLCRTLVSLCSVRGGLHPVRVIYFL